MVISERSSTGIDKTALAEFTSRIRGEVITSDHEAYEATRQTWSANFQRYPGLIVRSAGTADVAEAVRFANEHGLTIAVRSGGHSFAGFSTVDDGIVIDLSPMRDVDIDPAQRLAWVQPGITSEELAARTLPHGLVLTTGDVGSVGVGGLTLGGGIGWMVRKVGLTIDQLVAAEVVTADGRIVITSAEQHRDLFWAIRGGGGNFGIVTGLRFRLEPVGMIVGGVVMLPLTADVVRGYVELASNAPEALSTQINLVVAPPLPIVPPELVGTPVAIVLACWSGDIEEGREVVGRFTKLGGGAQLAMVDAMPYSALFDVVRDAAQPGMFGYVRSAFLDALDDELIDALIADVPPPLSMVQLRVLGGAMARVPVDATAFAHRDRALTLVIGGHTFDAAEANTVEAWVAALWERARPHGKGAYVNFLAAGEDRVRDAYPTATYDRLQRVKRQYDPDNVFRMNQNVRTDQ